MSEASSPLRLAVLQRVCTGYRANLFRRLSHRPELQMMLFIGEDIPSSKVRSTTELGGINLQRLPTRFVKLGRRVLPWHVGLIDALDKFNPDVILCEGESHFFGYLQALWFRLTRKRRVALIHWCFISLPGWSRVGGSSYRRFIKAFFRRFFDAFLLYSSFSRECLLELGEPREKAFIATNVGDVERFLASSDGLAETKAEARVKLGLPDRFTVLYLGTLEANKRPDVMLDLAERLADEPINFVLLGAGKMLDQLQVRSKRSGLSNVFLPGRVSESLSLYCRAADVLLLPGRGGVAISEAMACGLPIVIHQCDGTEFDLVEDRSNGFRLQTGNVEDFVQVVAALRRDPLACATMGRRSQELIRTRFNTDSMVNTILEAGRFACAARTRALGLGTQG